MAEKTLAFEIGTEELPAFALHHATMKLPDITAHLFDDAKVPHGQIEVYSTPRRLIVMIYGIPERTESTVEEFRGPAARIAFDEEGAPTKAVIGFAKGKGVDPSTLELRDEDGVQYVYAVKQTDAIDVIQVLPHLLEELIGAIPWSKSQRWGTRREQFSRPIRWILALFGDQVVPVQFAGLTASNVTKGHRFLSPEDKAVKDAESLIDTLRASFVVPSETEREQSIRNQIADIEQQVGLVADMPAKTMEEVVNLSEYPTVMVGVFNELFLAVPKEIIVDAMLVHQRYFPLFNKDGSLSNKFLITSNGDPVYQENIIDGNQRVVAARLYDAKFFYDEDLKQPLEAYVDKLSDVVFQESLGTMRAKTDRMVALTSFIAADAGLQGQDLEDAKRAALLAKADLVTGAVVEFTSMQGVMGCYYAQAAGETEQVARAISDHYRPRFAGDATPESLVGKVVATADKLDTICGLFAIDQGPTGSSDPFALRRSAIGVLAMQEDGLDISLLGAIDKSLTIYKEEGLEFNFDATREAVIDFFTTRVSVILRDQGIESDTIDAVLGSSTREPLVVIARARALEDARKNDRDTFEDLAVAYARANNLRDASLGTQVDEALLSPASLVLYKAINQAQEELNTALFADDYAHALTILAALRVPIDTFFTEVMVMAEDQAVRDNNIRLLNCFVEVFVNVADFGKMAKK